MKIRIALIVFAMNAGFTIAEVQQTLIPEAKVSVGCSTNDVLCDADEGSQGGVAVVVPAFLIDKQETSVAEYRACVNAEVCDRPFDFRRVHYCNYDAPGRDDYPVNCVNWNNAFAYCQWRGGRLAYEVEWELAARGGTSTPYFWGEEPASCKRAVMDPGKPGESDFETDGCWRDLSWPRNSFSANPFGLYDMIGGTSEWVMDWYDENVHADYFAKQLLRGPAEGKLKVIKGGSWDEKHWAQRVSNRFYKPVTGNP